MKKTINVIGLVKTNKLGTNYVDTAEGRVWLGKTSNFQPGQEIMGSAVCDEHTVTYKETTDGAGKKIPARDEKGWLCQNFITFDQQVKQAEGNYKLTLIGKKTAALAEVEPAALFAMG